MLTYYFKEKNYAIGFSSIIGLAGAVLLAELAMSLKLWTDPDREVETFVFTLSYAPPTLCLKTLFLSYVCQTLQKIYFILKRFERFGIFHLRQLACKTAKQRRCFFSCSFYYGFSFVVSI